MPEQKRIRVSPESAHLIESSKDLDRLVQFFELTHDLVLKHVTTMARFDQVFLDIAYIKLVIASMSSTSDETRQLIEIAQTMASKELASEDKKDKQTYQQIIQIIEQLTKPQNTLDQEQQQQEKPKRGLER